MKKIAFILAMLLPTAAFAQSVTFAGRASAGADYKIIKGLHLSVEEEIRSGDDFSSLGSIRSTVGISYKPVKFIKLGAGYTLINPWKSSANAFNNPRHRFFFDVAGNLRLGDFQLSLKERLQLTHRTGSFNYTQTTPNALALKSRLGVKYKGWKKLEPYAYFEVRTALNDPWGSYKTEVDDEGETYYPFTLSGYNHLYNNRYRGSIGLEWKISKHHELKPYMLLDYINEYEIDTKNDTDHNCYSFKSAAYNNFLRISAGLSYVFKF